jgi:hypothetical protein
MCVPLRDALMHPITELVLMAMTFLSDISRKAADERLPESTCLARRL